MQELGIFEEITKDFAELKRWLEQNSARELSADWETDSMYYTTLNLHGFRFSVATCKEDQIDDYIKVTKLDPDGDYDNDVEVAHVYNLGAPGTEATAHLIIEDRDALASLEHCISTLRLAQDLQHSLSENVLSSKKLKRVKI